MKGMGDQSATGLRSCGTAFENVLVKTGEIRLIEDRLETWGQVMKQSVLTSSNRHSGSLTGDRSLFEDYGWLPSVVGTGRAMLDLYAMPRAPDDFYGLEVEASTKPYLHEIPV